MCKPWCVLRQLWIQLNDVWEGNPCSHEDKTENVLKKLMIIKGAETAVAPGHVLRGTEDWKKWKINLGELRSWGSADVSYPQNKPKAFTADEIEDSSLLQREGHRGLWIQIEKYPWRTSQHANCLLDSRNILPPTGYGIYHFMTMLEKQQQQ